MKHHLHAFPATIYYYVLLLLLLLFTLLLSLADEIKLAILKEAALIENNELTKRPDYKMPNFGKD